MKKIDLTSAVFILCLTMGIFCCFMAYIMAPISNDLSLLFLANACLFATSAYVKMKQLDVEED